MKNLRKYAEIYKKFEIGVLIVLFAIAFIIIVLEVFSRFVLGHQFIWTDESSTAIQMVISFLGIGYGIRTKKHIRVDGLYKKLPDAVKCLINIVTDIMFVVICAFLIQAGMKICIQNWHSNFGTFAVAKGKVFLAAPVGYILAIIYCVMDATDELLSMCHKEKIFNFGSEEE